MLPIFITTTPAFRGRTQLFAVILSIPAIVVAKASFVQVRSMTHLLVQWEGKIVAELPPGKIYEITAPEPQHLILIADFNDQWQENLLRNDVTDTTEIVGQTNVRLMTDGIHAKLMTATALNSPEKEFPVIVTPGPSF
jgi:hypothetical protein